MTLPHRITRRGPKDGPKRPARKRSPASNRPPGPSPRLLQAAENPPCRCPGRGPIPGPGGLGPRSRRTAQNSPLSARAGQPRRRGVTMWPNSPAPKWAPEYSLPPSTAAPPMPESRTPRTESCQRLLPRQETPSPRAAVGSRSFSTAVGRENPSSSRFFTWVPV